MHRTCRFEPEARSVKRRACLGEGGEGFRLHVSGCRLGKLETLNVQRETFHLNREPSPPKQRTTLRESTQTAGHCGDVNVMIR
jgi:hypothetical protein